MEHTLSLSLTTPATAPGYWIDLVQQIPEALATFEEAAELIDELFELDPCVPLEEDPDAPPEEPDPDEPSKEEKIEAAKDRFWNGPAQRIQDELCLPADGSYIATVRLYRSHQDRPYTLLPADCTVEQVVTGNVEQIVKTIPVEKSSSISLDLPADQPVSAAWQGACYGPLGRLAANPAITVSGSSIYWDGAVTGTLRITYPLPYELITLAAGPDSALTALFHLSVDEIDLEPPEVDEQTEELCEDLWGHTIQPGDPGDCYIVHRHHVRCNCSGKLHPDSYDALETVPCPEEIPDGTIVGSRESTSYVHCDGDEDLVNDPEFYEQKCCTPPGALALPRCLVETSIYNGVGCTEEQRRRLLSINDGRVVLVGVGPKKTPCGVGRRIQRVDAKNCCDGVEPLATHPDNPTEITPLGSRLMRVLGGRDETIEEWVWTAGGGLVFSNGFDMIVGGRDQWVSAPAELCANNLIRVEDGCSGVGMLLVADIDPLLVELYHDYDLSTFEAGYLVFAVSGGRPPYVLQSGGVETYWHGLATEERTIELLTPGLVTLYVKREQRCLGDFDVIGSDSCADISTAPVDINELPIGIICIRSLVGGADPWGDVSDNNCFFLPHDPTWITYTQLFAPDTLGVGVECLPTGMHWVMWGGSQPALLVIGEKNEAGIYTVQRYFAADAAVLPGYCGWEGCEP